MGFQALLSPLLLRQNERKNFNNFFFVGPLVLAIRRSTILNLFSVAFGFITIVFMLIVAIFKGMYRLIYGKYRCVI